MSFFKFFLSLFLFCFLGTVSSQNVIKKDLGVSQQWYFKELAHSGVWQKASVPGSVHLDLVNARLIPDPYFRDNEKSLQWIEEKDWVYKTTFDVNEALFHAGNLDLVFEGIDTYASVVVNDSLVLRANNMFRTWRVDCKRFLKSGKNELVVNFNSSVRIAKQKYDSLQPKLPSDERVMVRKAAYQFGWDFGPRFVTAGIFKSVYIEAWNKAKFKSIQYVQNNVEKQAAFITAKMEVLSDQTDEFSILIFDSTSNKILKTKKINVQKGLNLIDVDFVISNPLLWWSNGLGNPNMYKLSAVLMSKNTKLCSTSTKIGIRTIEVVQDKDNKGSSFYFKLNGVPVFMKGANYIPQDNFVSRVSKEQYIQLIQQATNSNMNMLRVWGGGIYENDLFYDLCDENGILVWQDFMFACAMYPADSSFLENVEQEAIDNVVRLRNHPCIALWCGNNEIDEGWKNWGWQKNFKYTLSDSARIWKDYEKIFLQLLPSVVSKHDSQRFYWQSSPKIGWGRKESLLQGDSHYWGVWWGQEPFKVYKKKVGRFMSEYGFQGMPDLKTIQEFTIPSDRNIGSTVMSSHQKHPVGYQTIRKYMSKSYPEPTNFNQFIYQSQLLQAEGMKIAIEAHRRAKPYCMGSLYWQLNDCWPGVSWSGLDYKQHPKALQYFVKKAYQDVIITIDQENDSIKIYAVSDKPESIKGFLELKLMTFDGRIVWQKNIAIVIDSNASALVFHSALNDIQLKDIKTTVLLYAKLSQGGEVIVEQNHYFSELKELELPKDSIFSSTKIKNHEVKLTLYSKSLMKNLYITSDADGSYSDNYFDLLPNQAKEIDFIPSDKANIRHLKFRYETLNNALQK